jgi:hypothetical protein
MTEQTRQNLSPPTTQVAKDQAADVGRTAVDAGRHVTDTATEQAGQVVQEAKYQARNLVAEAREQATQQARAGQQNAADSLHGLAGELRQMADNGDRNGTATGFAGQAADRLGGIADWIGAREPGDLVEEVRRFARRRPGAFLLGAAVAGVLAGRLTRGAVDAQRDTGPDANDYSGRYPSDVATGPLPVASPPLPPAGPPPLYPPPVYPPSAYPTPGAGVAPGGTIGAPPGEATGGYPPHPTPAPRLPSVPPAPQRPVAPPAPQHLPRPGATTAEDYVQESERDTGPYEGHPR